MTVEIIFFTYSWLIHILDFPNFVLTDVQECKRIKTYNWFQQYNSVSYTAQRKLTHMDILLSPWRTFSVPHRGSACSAKDGK